MSDDQDIDIHSCEPAVVYIVLTVIMSFLFLIYSIKIGTVDLQTIISPVGVSYICCQFICIFLCFLMIGGLCSLSKVAAWIVIILMAISAGYSIYNMIVAMINPLTGTDKTNEINKIQTIPPTEEKPKEEEQKTYVGPEIIDETTTAVVFPF